MIEIRGVQKTFQSKRGLVGGGKVYALRGVDLTIEDGGAISFIGESGCGKTTLGRILAGLETFDEGQIWMDGTDISTLSVKDRTDVLRKIQLIQQDPYGSLNPSRTLGKVLFDPLQMQAKKLGKPRAWIEQRIYEVLTLVGLDPETTIAKYPHNLSGGQRQRFVVARALTVDPEVLVADEAVSMIDVSLRMGILKLLHDLRERLGIAIVFITHDVASARYIAENGKICVLYRGEVVEYGSTDEVIESPVHPYTQSLLSAMPVLRGLELPGKERYIPVEAMDSNTDLPGCLFAPRCRLATDECATNHPTLQTISDLKRSHRCFYPMIRQVVPTPIVKGE